MLGINKRLDKIEYRLARIDKMLEDMLTVPKQVPSVVIQKPRLKQNNWYPSDMAEYMRTRYRTADDIIAKFGYTKESVRTYIKNIRKSGLTVKTRGRAPTQYKIYNPHKGEKPNG